MKVTSNDLRQALKNNPRASGAALCRLLKGINRSTLMRLLDQFGPEVIRRGGSRRSRYALRRSLRGRSESLPLYRIDAGGTGLKQLTWLAGAADIDPIYLPDGGIVFAYHVSDPERYGVVEFDENMKAIATLQPQPEVHIRPDKASQYAVFANVLSSSKRLGLNKIAVIGAEQFAP